MILKKTADNQRLRLLHSDKGVKVRSGATRARLIAADRRTCGVSLRVFLRAQATTDALLGIRVLKFYGWELPFMKKILKFREAELGAVRRRPRCLP